MRSLRSFNSVSVAAPTFTTATPPANFAMRSCNFSLSNSEVVSSKCARITPTRAWIASEAPAPSTMVVVSFVTTTFAARPNWPICVDFNSKPKSSVINSPPVKIAISSSIALRRSPNPGAFTATALKVPRSLFIINVAAASPSTSSAIINNGLLC